MTLINRLRKVRDSLQKLPLRFGLPRMLENVTVYQSDGTLITIPIASHTEPTIATNQTLDIESINVAKQFSKLTISADYSFLINDSCRFYFNDSEWLPVHWSEENLELVVLLRYQYDNEWGSVIDWSNSQ